MYFCDDVIVWSVCQKYDVTNKILFSHSKFNSRILLLHMHNHIVSLYTIISSRINMTHNDFYFGRLFFSKDTFSF